MKRTVVFLLVLSYCFISFGQNYNYDLTFQRLDFSVNPAMRYIIGKVDYYFKNADSLLSIDLSDSLTVDSILYHGENADFTHTNNLITINLHQQPAKIDSVKIFYRGVPPKTGMGSFAVGVHGDSVPVMWTLSEPYGAKDWFPTKNNLGDKIDSLEVIVHCDSAYRAASNGLLIKDTIVDSVRTMIWLTHYPIASYLVAFAVTNYRVYYDTAYIGDTLKVPIMNMVYPEDYETARKQTPHAARCLEFYSHKFMVYPFYKEKYGHAEFGWGGGMEHQTMTFVGGFGQSLLAHELAHQWFGDYITCGSWHDIYLNEAFATYLEGLTAEAGIASYSFSDWLNSARTRFLKNPYGSVYVEDTTDVNRIFNYTYTYLKGALFLHLIRWTIGDSAFFAGLRSYLRDTSLAFGYARTPSLKSHLEQACGCDLSVLFDQWLYGDGYPSYNINWAQEGNRLVLSIEQTPRSDDIQVFKLKLPIEIKTLHGTDTTVVINDTTQNQEFDMPVKGLVSNVVFDPQEWIPATATVKGHLLTTTMKIYPNPVSDVLTIFALHPENLKSIYICDLSGRRVKQIPANFSGYEKHINLDGLHSGIYVIILETENYYQQFKFIKL